MSVVSVWAALQAAHVGLRYTSLLQLRFATLNQKRACALAAAHVHAVTASLGGTDLAAATQPAATAAPLSSTCISGSTGVAALPGVDRVNRSEPMLTPATSVRPRVRLGCSLQEAWGVDLPHGAGEATLAAWVALYEPDPYLLLARDGVAWVVVKQGATPRALLAAVWQAAWLEHALDDAGGGGGGGGGSAVAGIADGGLDLATLRASVEAARFYYSGFLTSLAEAGWDIETQPVLQLQQTRLVVADRDESTLG